MSKLVRLSISIDITGSRFVVPQPYLRVVFDVLFGWFCFRFFDFVFAPLSCGAFIYFVLQFCDGVLLSTLNPSLVVFIRVETEKFTRTIAARSVHSRCVRVSCIVLIFF